MNPLKSFDNFVNEKKDDVNESTHRLMGLALKAQKTIELCHLVVEKYAMNPDETRAILETTPFSYGVIKDYTDKLNKIR